jgi:GT2 family glycosyltransferase
MTASTVSVIVPTYNRAYCLRTAIDSALGQTYGHVEVVVVDDGSTDETPALVARHYGTDPRVVYVRQENGGVASARNLGFQVARGQLIALLDSDDEWFPWKLELQVACLVRHPEVVMIWTDMQAIDPEGHILHERYLRRMYSAYKWFRNDELFSRSDRLADVVPSLAPLVGEERVWVGDIFSAMVMGSLVHTSTVVMRRECREKVGLFNEALQPLGEDYDFHLRTSREGEVALADLPTIRYQRGMPDRLTRHRLVLAVHFLQTITETLARDRARITLPAWMIRDVLAEAHAWVGTELLDQGRGGEAARHFAASLRQKPWQPRTAALLLAGLLPQPLTRLLRGSWRRVTGRLTPPPAAS